MKIGIEKCKCSPDCDIYTLKGIGTFYQGSGFSKKEAKLIAKLVNNYFREKSLHKKNTIRKVRAKSKTSKIPISEARKAIRKVESERSKNYNNKKV